MASRAELWVELPPSCIITIFSSSFWTEYHQQVNIIYLAGFGLQEVLGPWFSHQSWNKLILWSSLSLLLTMSCVGWWRKEWGDKLTQHASFELSDLSIFTWLWHPLDIFRCPNLSSDIHGVSFRISEQLLLPLTVWVRMMRTLLAPRRHNCHHQLPLYQTLL